MVKLVLAVRNQSTLPTQSATNRANLHQTIRERCIRPPAIIITPPRSPTPEPLTPPTDRYVTTHSGAKLQLLSRTTNFDGVTRVTVRALPKKKQRKFSVARFALPQPQSASLPPRMAVLAGSYLQVPPLLYTRKDRLRGRRLSPEEKQESRKKKEERRKRKAEKRRAKEERREAKSLKSEQR